MTDFINTRIKHKRDTLENWLLNDPVLLAGELGLEIDTDKFKFGNGVNKYSELPYASADTLIDAISINNVPQTIEDKIVDIAFKNILSTDDKWQDASQGQMLVKDVNDVYAWVSPLTDAQLVARVRDAELAAQRAEEASTTAQSILTQCREVLYQMSNKFWFGTMQSYNNLPSISSDTIYIILDGFVPNE